MALPKHRLSGYIPIWVSKVNMHGIGFDLIPIFDLFSPLSRQASRNILQVVVPIPTITRLGRAEVSKTTRRKHKP